uniref:Type IV secretion system protein n=1 Tax=Pseudomonas syringae pv. actinidiae TaxID=103796 RepID=A0A2P0QI21_PSESF|nr:P-type DNA transfer ATPase VirB11 [Pseudomonas syringae]ARO45220.1 Type II/IV secretion system ATP hydrolase TadA/VirB11/CpaF, TadA subfamily [Pseudomonas syringae pv. actinidiae]
MSEIASFRRKLESLVTLLDDPEVTEIAVNGPDNVWAGYRGSRFMKPVVVEGISVPMIKSLAELIAAHTDQNVDTYKPILSGRIPINLDPGVPENERGDYRVQVVLAPAVEQHIGGIVCIRKPGINQITLDQYEKAGAFDLINEPRSNGQYSDDHLIELYRRKQWKEFFKGIVKARKNIMVSAGTNAGKTTYLNSLLQHVDPHERLVTIEDSREIKTLMKNVVHLIYSRGNQGKAQVTPFDLLESILRLTPDRAIMGELRGGEAFPYLELMNTGHSGSISSIHADSPELMFDRLASMASRGGADMSKDQLIEYSRQLIDVVIQWEYGFDGRRYISEVQYAKAA